MYNDINISKSKKFLKVVFYILLLFFLFLFSYHTEEELQIHKFHQKIRDVF